MAASYIEALLYEGEGWRWNADSPVGTGGAVVTYGFMVEAPAYYDGDFYDTIDGFQAFNEDQEAAVTAVLAQYAAIAALTFTDEPGEGELADLMLGMNDQVAFGSAGYAYAPGGDVGGDVWIAADKASNADPTPGAYGYMTLLHEIGHALGLKHPFGDTVTLDGAHDTTRYTVMSYTQQANNLFLRVTPDGDGYDFGYFSVFADGPMLYDIAAMQYLYGARTDSIDSFYTFNPDEPFFSCLWDGGGKDTISVSNFNAGCEIDLRAGEFSSIAVLPDAIPEGWEATAPTYDGKDNLSIAFGVVIENAIGGAGADTLTGNDAANRLTGNGGADSIAGSPGADTLAGGVGKDVLSGGAGKDQLSGGPGADWFAFASKPAGTNVDTVKDFSHAQGDRLALENSLFTIGASLSADELRVGTNISAAGGAKTLAQKILYDSDSGNLYYDSDGAATAHAPVLVATLTGHPKLVPGDFVVT